MGGADAGDLGLNPQNDGRIIRLNVPALSTEVRKKMVSRIKELSEEAKVSLRNIRRDGNKAADTAQKDKTLSEEEVENQIMRRGVEGQTQRYEKSSDTSILILINYSE